MEKLKQIIEQNSRWKTLDLYINRIEGHSQADFSLAIENAKALLEAISKEICEHRNIPIDGNPSVNAVIKKAFSALGFSGSQSLTQISSSLANIGQHIGEIRNEIGTTSHGKTLSEIRERNNQIDDLSKEFLIDSTEIVSCLLIRSFEDENLRTPIIENHLKYDQCEDFNEYWDGIFATYKMGEHQFNASKILFRLKNDEYALEYQTYKKNLDDD